MRNEYYCLVEYQAGLSKLTQCNFVVPVPVPVLVIVVSGIFFLLLLLLIIKSVFACWLWIGAPLID